MTLLAGSVTVTTGGAYSGTGLALALMAAEEAIWDAEVAAFTGAGGVAPSSAAKKAVFDGLAIRVNAYAAAIVGHFTANAVVFLTIGENTLSATFPVGDHDFTGVVT